VTWVSWRLQRTEILIGLGILALLAALLIPTGITMASELPIGIVVPASAAGATGSLVSWPGKKPPQTSMYAAETCSSIAGIDSASATGLARGKAARICGSPRKWSAWGCVM